MARIPEREALARRLGYELVRSGQASAPELQARLQISQPTFSRLVASMGDRLLVTGNARSRRYALRRPIADLSVSIPVFEVDEQARARRIARIHPVEPEAFYVESLSDEVDSRLYPDLPYFLNELRPSGFLGRLVPRQHPELEAPADVRLWSASQVLRYLAKFGWNLSGSLIVGDQAFERYLSHALSPPDRIGVSERKRRYPELAADALAATPGSSTGGEQPKFLVSLSSRPPLIVKFSPSTKDAASRRQADLLIAEHLAHGVLARHGQAAARSSLLEAGGRVFLEVERFDRTLAGGRRGILSLLALDAEFVGRLRSWTDSTAALVERKVLPESLLEPVRFLELFGRLIGNSDMHAGNLSFFVKGARVVGLAPAYDMLPALYSGPEGHLAERELGLPALTPADATVWDGASRAAIDFWGDVARERRVSAGFKRVAAENADRVRDWRRAGALLPA